MSYNQQSCRLKWYRRSAEQGYALALYSLGVIYENGEGAKKDYKQAVQWYRQAAKQGYAIAQSALGVMYENGLGVLQDNALAHMWYNLSAANGNDLGGQNRNEVANKMTSEEIFTAKAMARKCMSSDYKDCGE